MNTTMNDQIDISFIIPAYNSEATIERCISGIMKDRDSTAANCEILIIENGSTDETFQIAEKLASDNNNVFVFRSGKGSSRARNKGIEQSRGRIIVFIDSDDVWLQGSIRQIIDDWNFFSPDLILYDYQKNHRFIRHNYPIKNQLIKGADYDDARAWMISRPTLRMEVWAKAFNSEKIRNSKIRFNEDIEYVEDADFVLRFSSSAQSMLISSHTVYKYCIDMPSTIRSYDNRKAAVFERSIRQTKKEIENESKLIKAAYREHILCLLNVILVNEVFSRLIKRPFAERLNQMEQILKKDLFDETIRSITLKKTLSLYLLPELFFKLHLDPVGGAICYAKAFFNDHARKQAAKKSHIKKAREAQ